jgi:hypothetical protein
MKIVCRKCNNGWMSDIVKDSKPTLKSLILGKWPLLTSEKQFVLARWAALTIMVKEYDFDGTRSGSDEERSYMFLHRCPPPNWRVQIGRSAGYPTGWVWHRGLGLRHARDPVINHRANTQISFIALGEVIFQVSSTNYSFASASVHELAPRLDNLWTIWPTTSVPPARPDYALDQGDAERITEEFTQAMRAQVAGRHLPPGLPPIIIRR